MIGIGPTSESATRRQLTVLPETTEKRPINRIAAFQSCVILVVLAGCAFESVRGGGPISLSERVQEGFERYNNEDYPGNFAISLDGENFGYSHCPSFKCRPGGQKVALDSCTERSNGKPCKLYASGRTVVWNSLVNSQLENQLADDWSGVRSDRTANEVNVLFRNQTSEVLKVYWIDFEGQRKFYGDVDPDQQKKQGTFEGHHWELESESGKILGRFVAIAVDSKAEVTSK